MIELQNVSFSYANGGETGGVRDISLTIPDGQVVVFCGESGCGKTTVTRLLNGLIPHYFESALTGKALIEGENVSEQPLWKTASIVSSVFQNPRSQFFNVDTTSEVTFGCENLGMARDEILRRLEKTTAALGLERLLNRSIFELSGGEKQKIACAGAFMLEPAVYVLDEPSSNLDADAIFELRENGKTVYIITHDPELLCECCTDVVRLEAGKIADAYPMDEAGLEKIRSFFRLEET